METPLSALLLDVPQATVIWLVLLAAAALAVGGLVAFPVRTRRGVAGRIRRAALSPDPRLAAEADELTRYAEEVSVASERAATTAHRRRQEWLATQEAAESAWQAYDAAEAGVRRLTAAAALPLPRTPRTPAEYADREQYLHRAALRAYRRKQLSVGQLIAALAHDDGWDPRRHPVAQELALARIVRDGLRARQRAAAERERAAWRDADIAAAAARSLRDEALAAAARARAARQQLTTPPALRRPAARPARPRTATTALRPHGRPETRLV
ncbi:hypothetical protein SAMN05444365_109111 [Micromonospora pattaloongensis]|uniref:AP2/ERF domain-containing protein n=1 Tax=Micromonospora pattaloongensis TaxID=405436 RepID=A0A1H3RV24_9ACTN|nr:hypothetical protein [Micromonospora pattaloongensis]SDZ29584.1 hypothetical protein SAMN05444365_109111 [Micromonospora pattaloongensis]